MGARDFLFDLDGTLADSSPLHASAYRATAARYAPAILKAFDYEALKGLPTRAAFLSLGVGESPLLHQCVVEKRRLYRDALRAGTLAQLPGADQALGAVRERGGRNYLVTSGSAESVDLALDSLNLRDYFAGIITADDTSAGKPAPDPYLECVRRFGLEPWSAIAIEDAPAGVTSARSAGLRVIGVHNPQIATTVDLFFDSLIQLAAAISVRGMRRDGRTI